MKICLLGYNLVYSFFLGNLLHIIFRNEIGYRHPRFLKVTVEARSTKLKPDLLDFMQFRETLGPFSNRVIPNIGIYAAIPFVLQVTLNSWNIVDI